MTISTTAKVRPDPDYIVLLAHEEKFPGTDFTVCLRVLSGLRSPCCVIV